MSALPSAVEQGLKADGMRANEALKMTRTALLAAILEKVDALPLEDADRMELRLRTRLTKTSVLREIYAEDVFGEYALRELQSANAEESQPVSIAGKSANSRRT